MSSGRWQYKVQTIKTSVWSSNTDKHDAQIQDRLTRLGVEGWELVSVASYGHLNRLYLKRGS